MKVRFHYLFLTLAVGVLCSCSKTTSVCIYGGSSACATAAYAAAAKGCRVTLVCPDSVIGGMTTGGLGQTDIGNKQAITGLSRQFYRRIGEHYGKLEQWIFEPHVAEEILLKYLESPRVKVVKGYRLESVVKEGTRIVSIRCVPVGDDGDDIEVSADQFIDCSYEGDLMAKAGVSYFVGRESSDTYGEKWNGVQLLDQHQFPDGVDPYVEEGNPESGLLWGISDNVLEPDGSADKKVQAYNYRICLTDDPSNMIPIGRPEGYDSTRFELLLRLFKAQGEESFDVNKYFIWSRMPGRKTDINNRGGFSTDMIGMNHSYPEASWEERQKIIKAHKDYTLGLLYFYANDPRVPKPLRDEVSRWGLPKDEYITTGHWTHQLYIREARRMIGEYVATQKDCENKTTVPDGVGYAAYQMDSHNCDRIVVHKDGKAMVKNEGDVQKHGGVPYPISYRSLTPKRSECTNLLVPVCLSASHIAYGSIRMEPVFLEMGQACGIACAMAGKGDVQGIDVKALQESLEKDPYMDGKGPDILIDDDSDLVKGKEGWEVVRNGMDSYGPTHLRYRGESGDNHLEYVLDGSLDGEFDIYSFQSKWDAILRCLR